MRPTALRAEIYAGTERPVGIVHEAIKQRDLLSTVVEQQCAVRTAVECCSDTRRCQELFLKSNSLRANRSINDRTSARCGSNRSDASPRRARATVPGTCPSASVPRRSPRRRDRRGRRRTRCSRSRSRRTHRIHRRLAPSRSGPWRRRPPASRRRVPPSAPPPWQRLRVRTRRETSSRASASTGI